MSDFAPDNVFCSCGYLAPVISDRPGVNMANCANCGLIGFSTQGFPNWREEIPRLRPREEGESDVDVFMAQVDGDPTLGR